MNKDLKNVDISEQGDDTQTKIPSLKGASNWKSIRDLVTMKLSFLIDKSGFSVEYVIDTSKCEYRSAQETLEEEEIVDLEQVDVLKTCPVHSGKFLQRR